MRIERRAPLADVYRDTQRAKLRRQQFHPPIWALFLLAFVLGLSVGLVLLSLVLMLRGS